MNHETNSPRGDRRDGGTPLDGADLLALLLAQRADGGTEGEDLASARRDPRQATELAELEQFLAQCREAAQAGDARVQGTGAVDRILASTTREDLGVFGDLRLMRRFLRDRWGASAAVRVAAASLLLHVAAVPVLAWVALRPAAEEPTLQIQWELPRDAFPEPEAEQLNVDADEGDEVLLGAMDPAVTQGDGDTGPSESDPSGAKESSPGDGPEGAVAGERTEGADPRWTELNRRRVERYRLWQVRESAAGLDLVALRASEDLHPWLRVLAYRLEASMGGESMGGDGVESLRGLAQGDDGQGPRGLAVTRSLVVEALCDRLLGPGSEPESTNRVLDALDEVRGALEPWADDALMMADPAVGPLIQGALARAERMTRPAGELTSEVADRGVASAPGLRSLFESEGLSEHPLARCWIEADSQGD